MNETPTTSPAPAVSLSEFIPLEALVKTLGVSKAVVYGWTDDLALPYIKLGNRRYFHEPALAAWLKAQERSSKGQS